MFDGNPQQDADAKAMAEFYRTPKQDAEATAREGRPIFKMVEYVRISVPGDKNNLVDRQVRDDDRRRFAPQYHAFLADKPQDAAAGTLLSAWGGLGPERVAEYLFMRVQTVEQLAGISDGNLQKLGPGANDERKRAQEYLDSTKSRAPLLRLQSENKEQASRIAALEHALKEQGDRLDAVAAGQGLKATPVRQVAQAVPAEALEDAPVKRGRGRPKAAPKEAS